MRRLLGTLLAASLMAAVPSAARAYDCGATRCTAFQLVHAGASYGWYPAHWRYEFEDRSVHRVPREWHRSGDADLFQTNGMLTLVAKAGRRAAPAAATLTRYQATQGRWEVRMRTSDLTRGHQSYAVQVALVPADRSQRGCGSHDVDLLDFQPRHQRTARFAIHTPGTAYTFRTKLSRAVGNDQWHEFAVEVTPARISWFVDAHVVATERRVGTSPVPLQLQARLVPTSGAAMNKARLQLDWARYWTLAKRDARSVAAPAPQAHPAAC